MTVYFRSKRVVITERVIRVRIPHGWQVWHLDNLGEFATAHRGPDIDRRSWGLGWPALLVVFVASRMNGWILAAGSILLAASLCWFAVDWRRARRLATSELWARRGTTMVLVFALPRHEFGGACRALQRVLDRREDEGHD